MISGYDAKAYGGHGKSTTRFHCWIIPHTGMYASARYSEAVSGFTKFRD